MLMTRGACERDAFVLNIHCFYKYYRVYISK